jgi:N-acetylglucosaminyldiphosphoundecaprenol N-acetyl-beta-D-mannosaminyltransferase
LFSLALGRKEPVPVIPVKISFTEETLMAAASPVHSSARVHSTLRRPGIDRIGIGHALVDNCSSEQACEAIVTHARNSGQPAYVITPNAQHIVLLDQDKRLRKIYQQADLIVPDGISLVLAARLYGYSLKERVAGVDLFQTLCGLAAANNLRVFLLGGRTGSADLAGAKLQERFPGLEVSTYCPPVGFERTAAGLEQTAAAIRAANPHLVFVAFGAPKQEYWIHEHGLQLPVPVYIGVGGSFEMVAGVLRRAPQWIQQAGCEWLYRLCLEPRRMWRRYLIGNLQFGGIIVRQRIRRAFLNAFFSLIDKGSFGAELHESSLQQQRKLAARVISFVARESGDSSHRPDALAS